MRNFPLSGRERGGGSPLSAREKTRACIENVGSSSFVVLYNYLGLIPALVVASSYPLSFALSLLSRLSRTLSYPSAIVGAVPVL